MTALLNLNQKHRTPNTSIAIGGRINPMEGLCEKYYATNKFILSDCLKSQCIEYMAIAPPHLQ